MQIVGLTGGIASGKSTVASIFKNLGIAIVDADSIAKKAVEPNSKALKRLIETFGKQIVGHCGKLNRAALRNIMISDANCKRHIEEIIHPDVMELSLKEISKIRSKGVRFLIFEIPLLYETGLENMFSPIIVVYCPKYIQLERVIKRDKITKNQASAIIHAQLDIEQKKKLADFIIDNSTSIDKLQNQVYNIYIELKRHFGNPWP